MAYSATLIGCNTLESANRASKVARIRAAKRSAYWLSAGAQDILQRFMVERDAFHASMDDAENPACHVWQDGLEHFDALYPDNNDDTLAARRHYVTHGFRGIRIGRPRFSTSA